MTAARVVALFVVAAGLSGGLPAAEMRADIDVRFGHGTDAAETVQASVDLEPRVDFAASDRWQARLSARLRLDGANLLDPGVAVTET